MNINKEYINAILAIKTACNDLNDLIDTDEKALALMNDDITYYPFNKSYDEFVCDLNEWIEESIERITDDGK